MSSVLQKIIICIICLTSFSHAMAQENYFSEQTKVLKQLAKTIMTGETDSLRENANNKLKKLFLEIMNTKKSYLHNFEKIEHISVLQPKNKKFKLITWFTPYLNGTFKYFGIIQKCNKKGKKCEIYFLEDKIILSENYLNTSLEVSQWYGCLYYDIIPIKVGKENYYTLLGWDGNNTQTTKKIIDVLKINKKEDPVFGANIFNNNKKRISIEYWSKYPISLQYDPKLEYIVFDHLEPIDEISINNFSIYATNLSYDIFKKTKLGWKLEKEIYLNNEK